jgi:predicted aspartyl protease
MYDSISLQVPDDARRLYVPVEIAGKPKTLLIDTGAGVSLLNNDVVKELNLNIRETRVRTYDVTGKFTDRFVNTPMKIGRLTMNSMSFMVSDVPQETDGVAGLLGADYLSQFDVAIDPAAAKLDLLDPDHCEGLGVYWPASAIAKIPFERATSKHIIITVHLDGKPVRALLDTGADQSTFRINAAERLFAIKTGTADTPAVGHLNEREDLITYGHTFSTLTFEGVTVVNPKFALIPDMMSKPLSFVTTGTHIPEKNEVAQADILLGMNILRHLHFFIAYKEKVLYVTPATAPAK